MTVVQFGPDKVRAFGQHIALQASSGMVLIPWAQLREDITFSNTNLAATGLKIPREEASRWGLRPGDQVILAPTDTEPPEIDSVWGYTEPEILHQRPDFEADLVDGKRMDYPSSELPIDYLGDPTNTMRILRAVAPVGLGSQHFVYGPNESGKTWAMEQELRALLAATRDCVPPLNPQKTVFVRLDIGEGRAPDLAEKDKIFAPYMDGGGLTIFPFWGFGKHNAVNNAHVAKLTAWRLTELGFDVIFSIESFWGLVLAYSGITGEGGMASKGVPTAALDEAKPFLLAGNVPSGGSLTAVATILIEKGATRSSVVAQEVGLQNSTAKWAFMNQPRWVPRPWLSMSDSGTRKPELMFDEERLALHRELQHRSRTAKDGKTLGAQEQLENLMHLFSICPFDAKALFAYWEEQDQRAEEAEQDRAFNAFVQEGGSNLRGLVDKTEAVLGMMGVAGYDKAEAVKQLFAKLDSEQRAECLTLLEKAGLIDSADPEYILDQILQGERLHPTVALEILSEHLRGQPGTEEALNKAYFACGLQAPADPLEEMLTVSTLLERLTGRSFKRSVAAELQEAGIEPAEVFERLYGGESPQDLL